MYEPDDDDNDERVDERIRRRMTYRRTLSEESTAAELHP